MLKKDYTYDEKGSQLVLFLSTGVAAQAWNTALLPQLLVLDDWRLDELKEKGFHYFEGGDRNTLFLMEQAVDTNEAHLMKNGDTITAEGALGQMPIGQEQTELLTAKKDLKNANDLLYDLYAAEVLRRKGGGAQISQHTMDAVYDTLSKDARYDLSEPACLKHGVRNGLVVQGA